MGRDRQLEPRYRPAAVKLDLPLLEEAAVGVDPGSVDLTVRDSYVCAADPGALRQHALIATIPRRHGATVHGVVFAANRVLHSGVDDKHGHFVAAYGIETVTGGAVSVRVGLDACV